MTARARKEPSEERSGDPNGPAWKRGAIHSLAAGERVIEMDCCGFTMYAGHQDADGSYSCPCCEPVPPDALREALVKCVLPYEALTADQQSKKWIAPLIWRMMCDAVTTARAALAGPQERP